MFTTCHFLWRHAFVVLESFVAGGVRMFLNFFTSFSAVIACAVSGKVSNMEFKTGPTSFNEKQKNQ
jgi:hypothetical protein